MGNTDGLGLAIVERVQATLAEHSVELTQLDAAIGDGDHGTNMNRGFTAAWAKVQEQSDQSLAAVIKAVAMTLISTVGGAAGPLYGTAFLRASAVIPANGATTTTDLAAAMKAALEGVQARGKATTGEKTMVDAISPAVDALTAAVEAGASAVDALDRAAEAARQGMESTIPLLATKGRASYLGERSIGHQDPGATSSYYILRAIADLVRERADA
ncbi:MAG TPA: dihydroxyacetone kinase subunit DhaL [Thermomicrobiales bacterium]|jgi:dihydroxyacetone kinase-like protein|nr:dihydroxyacetone kinase subunit L [Chloroflexota bacterium]HQZ90279.1 dihydroxyacetone kinase subunit DhaL [Thermomicrobiales bacterium]HRA31043.1 dihydroxyacetone kinase subunit DhaL [Thermomicrobiales bacterium]